MRGAASEKLLGDAQFGVTFFTSSKREDICGTNGLPLTPNSIRILGRAQYLKSLNHPNLSQCIDIIRGKHERMIMVSEYYGMNLKSLLRNQDQQCSIPTVKLFEIAKDVLNALIYLNQHGLVSRNLSLENVIFSSNSTRMKLFNYGIHHMTNNGKYVSFPIGNPKYEAPEIFLSTVKKSPHLFSCDIWSLGIVMLELHLGRELWTELKMPQIIRKIASFLHTEDNVLQRILQEHHCPDGGKDMTPALKSVIEKCLDVNPSTRINAQQLLELIDGFLTETKPATNGQIYINGNVSEYDINSLSQSLRSSFSCLDVEAMKHNLRTEPTNAKLEAPTNTNATKLKEVDHLANRSVKEVYHLWQLAGGDVISELKKQGLTRKKAAILTLPSSMTLEGRLVGKAKDRSLLLDPTVIVLPMNELRKRLSAVCPEIYYPLVNPNRPLLLKQIAHQCKETESLPLIIREKDIEYQFKRIVLFDRLIKGYPYTKEIIHQESLQDIPPFFRAQIWSCLLEVKGDIQHTYNAIDKETPTSTDRQIEVDIPRCHQYDELLSSPTGHEKFKRVLKAWVVSNTEYVYWQGLDSLCAPFLYLHFNDEAMAFACLSAFIPKYLYNFFLKDNSAVIQEYLATFSQLIAFHDPQLTNHLDSIGFIPELYAIPWFLTMFSHVFPLHKIFHIWDKLLLGDSSFSLCVGLSILYQLRESLLNSGFNECILLFSDMPEIDIEKCVKDSVDVYNTTPRHIVARKHEPPAQSNGVWKNLFLS